MVQLRFVFGLILLVANFQSIYSFTNITTLHFPPQYDPYYTFHLYSHPADPQSLFVLLQPINATATPNVVLLLVDGSTFDVIADTKLPYLHTPSAATTGFYNPAQQLFVLVEAGKPNSTVNVFDSTNLQPTNCSFVIDTQVGMGARGLWIDDIIYLPATDPVYGWVFYGLDTSLCVLDSSPYRLSSSNKTYLNEGFFVNETIYLHGYDSVINLNVLIKGSFNAITHLIDVELTLPVTTANSFFSLLPMPPINPTQFLYVTPAGMVYICSLDSLKPVSNYSLKVPAKNQEVMGIYMFDGSYVAATININGNANGYLTQFTYDGTNLPGSITVPPTAGGQFLPLGNFLVAYGFPATRSFFLTRWTLVNPN